MSSSSSSRQGDLSVEDSEPTKRPAVEDDDGAPLQPLKRRRNRAKMSCRPCQRRKTKCDKDTNGCEACIKRDERHLCCWDPPPSRSAQPEPPAADFISQFNRMQRRLASLEQQISSSAPPQPAPAPQTSPLVTQSLQPTALSLPSFLPPPSLPFSAHPPSPEPPTPPYDPSDAEAEQAAAELENLALGRSQYGSLGRNSQLPCIGQISTRAAKSETPTAMVPGAGRFTTILLSSKAHGRSVFLSRAQNQSNLLDCLPERAVSEALVAEFFGDIGWIYNVLHQPTFVAETLELWDAVSTGCASRVDPAWLATYYIVLAWAVSTLGPTRSKDVLRCYPDAEVKILPESWIAASEQALTAADWAGKPQVRCIQAIFLKLALQRTAPTDIAPSLSSASGFYVWLSAAIRLSQLLGLHRLGADPSTMPPLDPAFPVHACSLRRELAKRIWTQLCSFDLLFCSGASIGQCTPGSYDTDLPLNLDDEDLGLHLIAEERPPTYLSDLAFTRMKLVIGRHSATQQLGDDVAAEPGYARILEMDAALQAEISIIELTHQDSNPKRRPYHRALLLMILQNRVIRLHRPYFIRGFRDERFSQSSSACLHAATAVCNGLQLLRTDDGNLEHLWWCWSYGLSATFCMFMALLNEEGSGNERELMLRARAFYVRGAQGDASSGVRDLSMQVVAVIDQLLLPHRREPTANATATSPAAAIFRTISHRLRSPKAGCAPSSSSLSSGSNYSTQDFVLPSPPPPTQPSAPDPSTFGEGDAELLTSSLFSPLSLNSFPQLPLLLPDALQQEPPLDFSFFDNLGAEAPPAGALGFDVEAARETLNQFNRPGIVMPSAAVLDDWQHLFNLVAPNGY
ncbi:hypothetical protein BCR35DRAFT_349666 [Leucosporidium creatinivorum]|uniref:Zn(2)-C6 fungal-type domain-containing protein n=1 Tax=Leucosporidium creatinivorum TaxID=106004 RepID=A0A1Y2G3X7_9BASI|nr:hypothetical protein BCR35DRAFT_349666 [Leucosporidium creatinivorum]